MKSYAFATIAILMSLSSGAFAAPKFGELIMTGADSAEIRYEEKCANGGNIHEADRKTFLDKMLANKDSKLSQLKQKLIKEMGEDIGGDGVYFSKFVTTYGDRNGCGESSHSVSFFISTLGYGNSHHFVTKYLATIDDNDSEGLRSLKLRSIQPVDIRDDYKGN